jgi:hypothetical protein
MNERRLIALRGFLLVGPLTAAWNIPGKIPAPLPGRPDRCGVPKGAIWPVDNSADEQNMIRELVRCKSIGDGNDPELVDRIQGELAAEATQAKFIKEMDADRHRVYKLAQETKSSLQSTKAELDQKTAALARTNADLEKAQQTAALTLEEAVEKFLRLDLPGVRATTRARIREAVIMYCSHDEPSLRTIARHLHVSHQRVNQWIKIFEKATGHRLIRSGRRESIRTRLEREHGERLPAKATPKRS